MRLVAKGLREMRWGARFWLFAMRYYVVPWYGWRASLSMKWNGAIRTPLWFRLSSIFVNYALLVFAIIFALFWVQSAAQGEWWLIVVLSFPMMANLMVMVLRLQTVFKLSGQRDQAGG